MMLLISPSKTLDFKGRPYPHYTLPVLLAQSRLLIDKLKKLNPAQVGELMGISEKLALLNWQRYQDFATPLTLNNARQSLLAFKGDVYSGLAAETFSAADLAYAQDHIRILSGLYGILRPLDLMQPYRLEMGTKFGAGRARNLYEFWGNRLTAAINSDLQQERQPLLVNLASDEYFKGIRPKNIRGPILKIAFKENKSGTYRVIGIHAKRARGLMVNYIIMNRLENRDDLQSFNCEGYAFKAGLSTDREMVFGRG